MPLRTKGTGEALRPAHDAEKPWDRKRWNTRFPSCAGIASEKTALARRSYGHPKGLGLRSDTTTTLKPAPAKFGDGSCSVDDLCYGDCSGAEGFMAECTRHSSFAPVELLTLGSRTRASSSSSESTAVSLRMLTHELESSTPDGKPMLPQPPLLSHSVQAEFATACGDLRTLPGPMPSLSLPSHSKTRYGADHQSSPHCCSYQDPNSMQARLCLLEERVSRIAGELQGAKGLLDAFNPAWFKAHLAEIQSKISILETAMILQTGPDSALSAKRPKSQIGVAESRDAVGGNNHRRVLDQPRTQIQTSTEPNLGGSSNLASCGPQLFTGVRTCGELPTDNPSGQNRHKTLQASNLDAFRHDSVRSSSGNRQDTSDIGSEAPGRTELAAVEPTDSPSPPPQAIQGKDISGRKDISSYQPSISSESELSRVAVERKGFCISGEGEQEMKMGKFGGNIGRALLTDSEPGPSTVFTGPRCQAPLEDATSYILPTESVDSFICLPQMLTSKFPFVDNHLHLEEKESILQVQPLSKDSSSAGLTYHANEGEMLQILQELSEADDAQYAEARLPPWTSRPAYKHQIEFGVPEANLDLFPLGQKLATAGWFVSEGEGIVLAHEDGVCSYYDVANMEEKAEFRCPTGFPGIGWQDCWLVRAAGADGRSNKYVVAASAPGGTGAGFCVWDFQDKNVTSYHSESSSLQCSGGDSSLCHDTGADHLLAQRGLRLPYYDFEASNQQYPVPEPEMSILTPATMPCQRPLWWYRPCGPLLVSAASSRRTLMLYDIRDGDVVTKWNTEKSIVALDNCSPLQWRNKGKIVVGLDEGIGIWDVNSMAARCLQSISFSGQTFQALYIPNGDAECSGGVWQRRSATEVSKGDGVLCTQQSVNLLDFRLPSGVALKMPSLYGDTQCVYAHGDFMFTGVRVERLGPGSPVQHKVVEWSVRQGKPIHYYHIPGLAVPNSLRQVWGSSETVMAADSNGLFVFKAEGTGENANNAQQGGLEVIGGNGLVLPTFDYSFSRILLISRNRPASWCHWPK